MNLLIKAPVIDFHLTLVALLVLFSILSPKQNNYKSDHTKR